MQPCACRGSAKFIHKACLEKWRRTSPQEDAAYRCGQCMDKYRDALSLELLSARLQAERTSGRSTLSTLSTLAHELQVQGKFDEAEPLFREALELRRETLGSRHPATLASINPSGWGINIVDAPLSGAWHVLWGATGTPLGRAEGCS